MMPRTLIAATALLAVALLPALASADAASALRCQRAIAKAHGKHLKTRGKIIQRCKDAAVLKGAPASPTDCPTSTDDPRLDRAKAKLENKIAAACGGGNRLCSATDVGTDADEPLAGLGWDIVACPDLGTEGCTNPIGHCGDIATCLACVASETVDRGTGIAYDLLLGPFATGSALNKCQAMLGKAGSRFLFDRAKQLGTCWDKVLRGTTGFVVPPGCPETDDGTVARLVTAEQKKIKSICETCNAGGDDDLDGQCDAPGTAYDAAAIGFEPDCPDVIVPSSGRNCAFEGVTTLAQIIDCVDCLAEYLTDCGAALSVPAATSYPAECTPLP